MNWLAVLPAVATIVITFKTKKLIPSLITGIVLGAVLKAKSVIDGLTLIGGYIVGVLSEKGSAYALSFLVIYSALTEMISMAGGITGFTEKIEKHLKSEKGVLGWTWLLCLPTFFNTSFHFVSVGTVMSQVLDKVKASKEKFAFVLSITTLQLILLIPVASANIGYMVTLVAANMKDIGAADSAYAVVAKSVLWNFYSWTMILLALGVTLFSLRFGKLKIGHAKVGELTQAHLNKKRETEKKIEEYPRRILNLSVPVVILLAGTVLMYWWTGHKKAPGFLGAFRQADFNVALFTGAVAALVLTGIYYLFQKISLAEIQAHIIKGAEKVTGLIVMLILSWALAKVMQDLQFNELIRSVIPSTMPRLLVPAVIFIISGIFSYTIGSSWATWALMIPLASAFSGSMGIAFPVMAGAVWSGGAVTEVVSPIAAEMAGIAYNKHFVTALPFAFIGIVIAAAAFIVSGLFF